MRPSESRGNYRRDVNRKARSDLIWDNPENIHNTDRARRQEKWQRLTKQNEKEIWGEYNRTYKARSKEGLALTGPQRALVHGSVKMLVDRPETYRHFFRKSQSEKAGKKSLHNVLLADNVARSYGGGSGQGDEAIPALLSAPQMAALLLDVYQDPTSSDYTGAEEWAFRTLQVINFRMKDYYKDNFLLMKNETLILTSYLYEEEIDLVNYLNGKRKKAILIDLIDICDVVRTWSQGVFAQHFKPVFVERVLDVFLFDGPTVMIAFVFGILVAFKEDIMLAQTESDFYHTIWRIPSYISNWKHIDVVFRKAKELFTQEKGKFVQRQRQKKDWNLMLQLTSKSKLLIANKSGDREAIQKRLQREKNQSQRSDMKIAAELFHMDNRSNSSDEDIEEKNEIELQHLREENDRLRDMEQKLQDQLESCRAELKRATESARGVQRTGRSGAGNFSISMSEVDDTDRRPARQEHIAKPQKHIGPVSRYSGFNISYKEAMKTVRRPTIYMQGPLWKLGTGGFLRKDQLQEKRRWFVLIDHYLTYFKTEMNTTPSKDRCLDIRGHTITPCSHERGKFALEISKILTEATNSKPAEKFQMILITKEKNSKDSQRMRDLWLTALRAAAAKVKIPDILDDALRKKKGR